MLHGETQEERGGGRWLSEIALPGVDDFEMEWVTRRSVVDHAFLLRLCRLAKRWRSSGHVLLCGYAGDIVFDGAATTERSVFSVPIET